MIETFKFHFKINVINVQLPAIHFRECTWFGWLLITQNFQIMQPITSSQYNIIYLHYYVDWSNFGLSAQNFGHLKVTLFWVDPKILIALLLPKYYLTERLMKAEVAFFFKWTTDIRHRSVSYLSLKLHRFHRKWYPFTRKVDIF